MFDKDEVQQIEAAKLEVKQETREMESASRDPLASEMRLLDHFAGIALQAMLTSGEYDLYKSEYAKQAYDYAEAMLEERSSR